MKAVVSRILSFLIVYLFDGISLQMVVAGGSLACFKSLMVKEVPN